jgi:serine/threonine protein kinase
MDRIMHFKNVTDYGILQAKFYVAIDEFPAVCNACVGSGNLRLWDGGGFLFLEANKSTASVNAMEKLTECTKCMNASNAKYAAASEPTAAVGCPFSQSSSFRAISCGKGCGMSDSAIPPAEQDGLWNPPWDVGQPTVHNYYSGCVAGHLDVNGQPRWRAQGCEHHADESFYKDGLRWSKTPLFATVVEFKPGYSRSGGARSKMLPACGPGGVCTCPFIGASSLLLQAGAEESLVVSKIMCRQRGLIQAPSFELQFSDQHKLAEDFKLRLDMSGGLLPVVIELMSNNLKTIPNGHFDQITGIRLEGIEIDDNLLSQIPRIRQPGLLSLSLKYNKIEFVDLDELQGLPRLKYLNLRNNYITKVVGKQFPPTLLYLDLQDQNDNSGLNFISPMAIASLRGEWSRFEHDAGPSSLGSSCKPLKSDLGMAWGCCCANGYGELCRNTFGSVGCDQKWNATDSNGTATGTRFQGKSIVRVILLVTLVLIVVGAVLLRFLYQRSGTDGGGDEHQFAENPHWLSRNNALLAGKFAAVARERAETRFVIEYRQLVNEVSMEAFQREFRKLEVPQVAVKVGAELGRGQSGVVFLGVLDTVDVAVKTREIASAVDMLGAAGAVADEALLLEALLLNGLRHPAIVSLLAVVGESAPVFVCIELMCNGDLRGFLRRQRPQKRACTSDLSVMQGKPITAQVMMLMAAKLGSAMSFLEQHNIIHRDVAARNVLVGTEAIDVKMADLGAARNVHRTSESSYQGVYVATTEHNPARWMPLEAIREAKFSHKSDVFAFGVLMWEVLSMGATPWGAFGVHEFTGALARGERMLLPDAFKSQQRELGDGIGTLGKRERDVTRSEIYLAQKIYAVAMRCWADKPEKRPHFHQLETEFAIHETVLMAESRRCGRMLATTDRSHVTEIGDVSLRVPGGSKMGAATSHNSKGVDMKVTLDTEGYVDDVCVATTRNGPIKVENIQNGPVLDEQGYVRETRLAPPRTSAASSQPNLNSDGETVPQTTLSLESPPSGIAPRTSRKPSLYLGFGGNHQGQPGTKKLHPDETRL